MGGKIFIPFSRDLYIKLAHIIKDKNTHPEDILENLCIKFIKEQKQTSDSQELEKKEISRDSLLSCDYDFINHTKREGIPQYIIDSLINILHDMRKYSQDFLVKGKGRNWTTKPNNFVSFEIQNRNKRIRIITRQIPDMLLRSITTIDIRPHWGGNYIRFFLEDPMQAGDIRRIIRYSHKKY